MSETVIRTRAGRCRFGLATTDITPPPDSYHRNWGAAAHDAAVGIHRPLWGAAALLAPEESGAEHLLVTLDLGWLRTAEMEELLDRLHAGTGLPSGQLVVTFSHTHSAINLDLARTGEPGGHRIRPYLDALPERLLEAVARARADLAPVELTYAMGQCSLAANRDHWDEARGIWTCGTDPDGPADDRVQVVRVTRPGGAPVAFVVNYACHPTTLAWTNRLLSPDYVGAMRELVETTTGVPCLFALGTCGDLGPRDGFVGEPAVADCNGRQLGYAALQAIESMPPAGTEMRYAGPVVSGATLGIWEHRPVAPERAAALRTFRATVLELSLPCRELPSAAEVETELERWRQREQRALVEDRAEEAAECRARLERGRRLLRRLEELPPDGQARYEVILWQVGDGVWVWFNGEPYSLMQRELRSRFPGTPIVTGVLCNRPHSYILPRERFGLGLYQEECSTLAPGALEQILEAIAGQLQSWGLD
jgi:hypothetical protein